MSNDPRDLFDDDDNFGFDDDDFNFDDNDDNLLEDDDLSGFGDEDDFDMGGFDDLDDGADLDDDLLLGDEDDFSLDDEEEEFEEEGGGGPSRTFIIIAVLMIVILLGGVGLLAFAILNQGPSELDVTRTAIAEANATVEEQIRQTSTAGAALAVSETAAALVSPTPTPTEEPSETPTEEVDLTGTAVAEETNAAANLFLTQTRAAQTDTPIPSDTPQPLPEETEEMPTTVPTISVDDVALTATALSGILVPPTEVLEQPTAAVGATPGGGATGGPIGGELPDTGLFDEMGTGGVGMFFMMVFGLLGVIFVSRRMRASINDKS